MIGRDDTPVLPRGVRVHFDRVRDAWVLLAPERAISLDPIGRAILESIDGERTMAEIASGLAQAFDAPLDEVSRDCAEFVHSLAERRMVEVRR